MCLTHILAYYQYVLLSDHQVLCAAHCAGVSPFVSLGLSKHLMGSNEADEFEKIEHIPVAEYVIHPNYNSATSDHDFMMIRLEWASQLYGADDIVSLDTPTDALDLDDGAAHELIVMGFGTTSSGGTSPNTLQEVTVDYIPNESCGSYTPNLIKDSMLCAGRAGKDSCQVRCVEEKTCVHMILC